uniref:Uncharacterized protein n=1 Tax=Anopheles coluzzii TaxID=1518534 RepID=A0A8W7PAW8_ANOCL
MIDNGYSYVTRDNLRYTELNDGRSYAQMGTLSSPPSMANRGMPEYDSSVVHLANHRPGGTSPQFPNRQSANINTNNGNTSTSANTSNTNSNAVYTSEVSESRPAEVNTNEYTNTPERPLGMGFARPQPPSASYSRESTPDSGGSYYADSYRDQSGYSPHTSYGMVVQPDYSNGYPGYAPNAYQYSGPYASSLGTTVYPPTVPTSYPASSSSSFVTPPTLGQHIAPHDNLLKAG